MRRIAGACLGLLLSGSPGGPGADVSCARQRHAPTACRRSRCRSCRRSRPTASSARRSCAAWHPTEREILVTTSFGAVPQLHRVRMPGGARTQITFFTDGVSTRPGAVFLPKGQSFVFQKDTAGGGEADQLFRYDLARGAAVLLTDGKSRHGGPAISRTGLIAYDSTRARREESRSLRDEPDGAGQRAGCSCRPKASGPRSTGVLTRRRSSRSASSLVRNARCGPCASRPARRR